MKSLAQKLEQLTGILGTAAATEWETDFLESVCEKSRLLDRPRSGVARWDTRYLTPRQVDVLDSLWRKHFA